MGIPQVRNVRRALGRLAKQRRKFLQSRKEGERGQTSILRSWWEWKKLGGGVPSEEGGEKATSEAVREIEERGWKWRQEMDGFGEFVSETEEKEGDFMLIPCGKALHLDRLPAELEARRREALEKGREGEEVEEGDEEDDLLFGLYEVGNPAAFFAMPWLEADLVKSHLPRFYLDAVESL